MTAHTLLAPSRSHGTAASTGSPRPGWASSGRPCRCVEDDGLIEAYDASAARDDAAPPADQPGERVAALNLAVAVVVGITGRSDGVGGDRIRQDPHDRW